MIEFNLGLLYQIRHDGTIWFRDSSIKDWRRSGDFKSIRYLETLEIERNIHGLQKKFLELYRERARPKHAVDVF